MSNKLLMLFPVAVLALMLGGCAPPQAAVVDTAAEEAKIRDIEKAWVADLATKDIEKVMPHYAADGILMAGGGPAAKGKDAIRVGMKGMLADPNFKLEFTPARVEVAKSGDLAYTAGSYQLSVTDPKTKAIVNDKGSYTTVYKKQADGTWAAAVDIATSEIAPQQ